MNSERERQITSIFHSAIEREGAERRAFLDGACASDPELRGEVESLIESHESAGSFIDAPAYQRSADLIGDEHQAALVGRTLGRYRIVSLLGAGGMGEVYLAEDTQLGRRLAIKVLARSLTEDSAIVTRFRQEARAASALNHSNIVTVYEVGESDGTHFIATEFVEGVTLRDLMARTTLDVSQAIDIIAQVASALVKAHGAGVVHRDIKPENVMVDAEGHAKVLDFGIAKLTEQARGGAMEAATVLKVETSPGAVMGTAHYMSPEQARAAGVDSRTDIFSLGVVLYEMLSGRQPFEGATASDVMSSILNKEPPPLARYNREVTEALDLVVQKALAKDRDERYQTAKEMQADLHRVRQRMETGATSDFAQPTGAGADEVRPTSLKAIDTGEKIGAAPTDKAAQIHTTSSAEYIVTEIKRHKRGVLVALALVVIAGGLFAAYRYAFQRKPAVAHFERVKMTRITTDGNIRSVAVSPDGKYIAYSLLEDGKRSLWTKHLGTDSRVQIVAAPDAISITPYFFSADGGYVFYGLWESQYPVGALFQVAVLGGTPKKILTDLTAPAALSPDGKTLAFMRYRPGAATEQYEVWLATADGANERRLWACAEPKWLEFHGISWSPDGKLLTVAYGSEEGGDHMTLATIAVADSTFKIVTPHRWIEVGRVAWFGDGSGMAVVAMESDSRNWQIWRVSYPEGEVQRITNDLHNYGTTSLTLTADSRTLVALQLESTRNIFVATNGDAKSARAVTARAGTCEGCSGMEWTPDGRLVYTSTLGGARRVWVMNADGSDPKPLIELGKDGFMPRVSPDGRYIFFRSRRTKTEQVWRMEIDGTRPVQLTEGGGVEDFSLTPDGRWLIYDLFEHGTWKISTDGGAATKISDTPSWSAEVSPDGRFIILDSFIAQTTQRRLAVLEFNDLAPFRSFDLPGTAAAPWRFSADFRAIIYTDTRGSVSNLWRLPLDGSPAKPITDFNSDVINFFAYSRDGKQVALSRGSTTRDALIISDEEK